MTRSVTLKYLKTFPGPYAIIKPNYDSCSRSNKNHCISELSYPALSALCIGSVVMLLKHYIVEEKLMNGFIDTVIDIIYDDPRGPNIQGSLPLYVIVDFPESTLQTRFTYTYSCNK